MPEPQTPAQPDATPSGPKAEQGGQSQSQHSQEQQEPQSFTQADIDKAIDGVVARERKKHATEVKELKAQAAVGATAEERIASLEQEIETTKREALKRRVQAANQISDEDAELFLTGGDEDTLTAQAKRLAERDADRRKGGNHVPNEGRTTPPAKPDGRQEMADFMFGPS